MKIWWGKLSVYNRKLRFTAPLARRRKTKFPTLKPTDDNFEYSYHLTICNFTTNIFHNLSKAR